MYLGYIDPGSGSLIFSAIVASILAIPYFLRSQIGRVVGRFRGGDSAEGSAAATATAAPTPTRTPSATGAASDQRTA